MGDQQIATLAGGCFWCLEAIFDQLSGVHSVESGYTGGHVPDPIYQDVCDGETGHAETVQVTFGSSVLTYHDLLTVFFTVHDPTTLNRQGADVGTQYRSAIFYHNDEQKCVAEEVMAEITAAKLWQDPLVTELAAYDKFYLAEDYHQEYYANNRFQPYCQFVIASKVVKFRKEFVERLKK